MRLFTKQLKFEKIVDRHLLHKTSNKLLNNFKQEELQHIC